jgi:serine O-acetyltransferase
MNRFEADVGAPLSAVSAEVPDWSREAKAFWHWHPSRSLLASLRAYETLRGATRLDRVLMRWVVVMRHRFWSAVTGAEIPLSCQIGGGLLLPHPNGVVVHPAARIGPNCLLMQQVTLGTGARSPGAPTLAGHVDVGAGAKVLGEVTVGAHAVVGANAVVLCDVPAGSTAIGVPARILPPRDTSMAAQGREAQA